MTDKTELEVTAADREALDDIWAVCLLPSRRNFEETADAACLQILARHRLTTRTPDPTPVAWMHTLHMEGGQTRERLLDWDGVDEYEPSRTGFGFPGRDYSECYPVTVTPLYAHPPAVPADGLVDALERIAAPAIVSLDQCPAPDQPNGWRHLAVDRIDIARNALAAHRGEA